jgi:hypothetical protein
VGPGDYLTAIAYAAGVTVDDIWSDPANTQNGISLGIAKYWSRRGVEPGRTIDPHVTIDSQKFDMSATAADPGASFVQFDVMKALSPEQRACNLGAPFSDMPILLPFSTEVNDFQLTAAHEFGHSVLRDERPSPPDKVFSMTHKGSSVLVQHVTNPSDYPKPPREIDLMLYWNGFHQDEYYGRDVVAEDDAKGAISIARVEFFAR